MEGFPDVELAVMDILTPVAQTLDPPAKTGTAFDNALTVRIRVNRTGGPVRPFEDQAVVEVTCLCDTRPESQALNGLVVQALNDQRAVETAAGFVDKIASFVAPFPIPDLNLDERAVTSTWTVTSRLQDLPA